jgi:hypothetical protein
MIVYIAIHIYNTWRENEKGKERIFKNLLLTIVIINNVDDDDDHDDNKGAVECRWVIEYDCWFYTCLDL